VKTTLTKLALLLWNTRGVSNLRQWRCRCRFEFPQNRRVRTLWLGPSLWPLCQIGSASRMLRSSRERWRQDAREVGIAQQAIEIDAQGVSRQLDAEGGDLNARLPAPPIGR